MTPTLITPTLPDGQADLLHHFAGEGRQPLTLGAVTAISRFSTDLLPGCRGFRNG